MFERLAEFEAFCTAPNGETWAEERNGLGLRFWFLLGMGLVGTGGASAVEDALMWATRFLTDAFLALRPGTLGGRAVSLGSSIEKLVE